MSITFVQFLELLGYRLCPGYEGDCDQGQFRFRQSFVYRLCPGYEGDCDWIAVLVIHAIGIDCAPDTKGIATVRCQVSPAPKYRLCPGYEGDCDYCFDSFTTVIRYRLCPGYEGDCDPIARLYRKSPCIDCAPDTKGIATVRGPSTDNARV